MGMLAELRGQIAAALRGIPGTEVSAYMVPAPAHTSLQVFPSEVAFDSQFGRGSDTWTFVVEALTPLSDVESAQIELDELLDPYGARSVKQTVEAAFGRGRAHVTGATGYAAYKVDDGSLRLGVRFTVDIPKAGQAV